MPNTAQQVGSNGKPALSRIGAVIGTLGTLLLFSSIIMGVNAPEAKEFAAFVTHYLPFLERFDSSSIGFTGLIAGLFGSIVGWSMFYDNLPIPNEVIPAPQPLNLVSTEPWRQVTGLRILEQLKKELKEWEDPLPNIYEDAVKAHSQLSSAKGRLEYKNLRIRLQYCQGAINNAQIRIDDLKQRIQKIFNGNVQADLLEHEEQIQKLKRERQDFQTQLKEAETKLSSVSNNNDNEWLRDSLRHRIKRIDLDIIERETHIKELKGFDFKRLYQQLGLASDFVHIENPELQNIKAKADIINSFTPAIPTSTELKEHPDDSKMNNARQRRKRDFQWEMETKAGAKVDKLDALQRWKKMKRKEILTDNSLTAEEKEQQLDLLDKSFNEHKRKLESDFNILEEE